ncbi:MAG: pseudaminic acid synthase [Candidatus Sungbacteria bacterium]|nr:pseudaminic acid synthase [Candidatus Sungbacteria bacterium]
MKEFKIGEREIGLDHPAFIVAEMSVNHKQDYAKASAIIKAAAEVGVDAVKLQTFTPDTITLPSREPWFLVGGKDNPGKWQQKTFYDLYQEAYMPWDWQPKLKQEAEALGLTLFSTPFDVTAVDFLEGINMPCYKIAAYESTDIILLRRVAKTKKPVIMSVGFATLDEIELSMQTLRKNDAKDIALLHCLTSYAKKADSNRTNLRLIPDLRDRFDVVSGFSDNMGGIEAPILAAAVGASIIEKHFILSHEDQTLDDRFSLDPKEFKKMVDVIRYQEELLGKVNYGPQTEAEEYNKRFRRSLFVSADTKKGELFTDQNVKSIRPADGLPTKFYDQVMGRRAGRDVKVGTPLSWALIEK